MCDSCKNELKQQLASGQPSHDERLIQLTQSYSVIFKLLAVDAWTSIHLVLLLRISQLSDCASKILP